MLLHADATYDYETGGEILAAYKGLKAQAISETQGTQKANRDAALKAGATERGGTGQAAKRYFRRTALINMKVNDPQKYEAMLPDIERAYMEGRVK